MAAPKLRFKEFDGDWEVNTIQHFLDNNFILDQMDGNHGELYPKSEEFSSAGVPYVSATDFSSGTVDFSQCKRLPLERAALFKKGIAKNGDVLFAHNATVGPVAILETELDFVILSTTATYYRCNGNFLNNYYLKNYFESDFFVQQYFGIMSQSTRNQVPITTQRKLSISIPIIKEQTKIASFLSAVDEKISQLTRKHQLLSQYKQGMMQKLFSQQLRFKADDGSEFGEWVNSYIGNECKITTGNKDTQNKVDDGLYPFFVRSQTVEKINSYSMDCEAILTSGDGVGVGKNYHYINGKFDFHQRVYCLYEFSERLVGRYLYIYFSNYFYDRVKRLSAKNSVDSVRMDMISKMEIKLPCLEEQTKIANFLSAIDQKIEVVAQQIEQAKTWKKGLLQQMFV
ncbi:restriction endonuclease subunit S [Acinetobacter indicus]|uniref:restriction endonuclease subunit S n=1 Tax=Acinetobacter indicus TaxID=756892 RepID=UPI000CEBF2B4|nr:restriction endonuclease subunit S [Acinetobacter indicus]